MGKKYSPVLLLFFGVTGLVNAQKFILPAVTVTASRIQSAMVSDLRESTVLNRGDVEKLPVQSVSELLGYLGQVEFSQRGTGGVQADLGVRGSSFEQVIVLVNGIRMNDPQTGHHNSDLPVTLDEIERIEILPGHGSSMYGPDAFGGVIHIITRTPQGRGIMLRLNGGSFRTRGGGISATTRLGAWQHRFGYERSSSDGHRYDTDHVMNTASLESRGRVFNKRLQTRVAVSTKDFGANGFYAAMPSWEATRAYTAQGGITWSENGRSRLQSRLSLRHHRDHFILTIENPDLYVNRQNTWSAALETEWTGRISSTVMGAAGVEIYGDALESPGLGDHQRRRLGVFGEAAKTFNGGVVLHGGLRLDGFDNRRTELSPTVSLKYPVTSQFLLRGSVGRAFRAPSYTELYYHSPANQGDVNLLPESAWSFETGAVYKEQRWQIGLTGFSREESNRIDWIQLPRENAAKYWQAVNLGRLSLRGLSAQMQVTFCTALGMKANYTAMTRRIKDKEAVISKYSWAIPRHRGQLTLHWSPRPQWRISHVSRYLIRDDKSSLLLTDLRLVWRIMGFENSLNLKNIWDTDYEEIRGVPLPGRHFLLGTSYAF